MVLDKRLCCTVEVARTDIVAEALPCLQYLVSEAVASAAMSGKRERKRL